MTPWVALSEYDVAPHNAPLFLIGERWARLHSVGLSRVDGAKQLVLDELGELPSTANATLTSAELDADWAVADILSGFEGQDQAVQQAMLAGYARVGYEFLDTIRPGFTDDVLDRLGVPVAPSKPLEWPLEIPTLLSGLGVELQLHDKAVSLVITRSGESRHAWKNAPRQTFLLLLALVLVGVNCMPLFRRDMAWLRRLVPASPLYPVLWPEGPISEQQVRALGAHADGFEQALSLACMLRANPAPPGTTIVAHGLQIVESIFERPPLPEQAMALGDALVQVALHVAHLQPGGPWSESFMQLAIVFQGTACTGESSDETRLMALTKGLYQCPWFPSPFSSHGTRPILNTWNSLLIMYRNFGTASLARGEGRGARTCVLRSAMLRGLFAARRVLPKVFAATMSRDPEVAVAALPLLRLTVKNYATLLMSLADAAGVEQGVTSGWGALFHPGAGSAALLYELDWICRFLNVAATDGFGLDEARSFIRQGAPFLKWDGDASSGDVTRLRPDDSTN